MRPVKVKVFLPIIIICFTIALAFHFIALAAIDAPHNESSNINCGSCHGQGLLNSPFWGGSMSYDELCTNCHKVSSGPYTETNAPLVKTHSSENTSENYGTWSWECRNCHDPHYQKQKNYKNTDAANLYLATGTIINCVDNGDGTSTLTYSSITYKTDWEATRLLEKTSEYRRTILFPNVGKLGYSYPVIGIDEGAKEITVSGDATPVYQYISSSTFAMMYGQYIKDSIESSQVKMVDRKWTSSFADGDVTYDGVCEICHTQTLYHQNDGSGTPHYPSEKCTICHLHMDGFADSDHTGGIGADCEGCHGKDSDNGGVGTTQSHSTHTENDSDDIKGPHETCATCHDTDNYPYFRDSGINCGGDYHKRQITIHSSEVEEDLTDFPLLFSIIDADLKDVVHGGHVVSADGDDISFYDSSDVLLDYEIEKYDRSTGELVAWIRIPSLSSSTDTVIEIRYGDSSITTSQENPEGVWDSNYEGVWHLKEEAAGTGSVDTYKDSTANISHGSDFVSDTNKPGKINSGQKFDGMDDYIKISHKDELNANTAISIELWVNYAGQLASSGFAGLIGKNTTADWDTNHSGWSINLPGNGKIQFAIGDGTAMRGCTTLNEYNDLQWHHIVGTWNGGLLKLYVDGDEADYTIQSSASNSLDSTTEVRIGEYAFITGLNRHFTGIIDEVRISSISRSAAWIKTSYDNQDSPSTFFSVGIERCADDSLPILHLIDLASTTACDTCHSAGGAFDGVAMAKANWNTGIYEMDGKTLKSGKEKWCASCHDDAPAYSQVETSTIILDTHDATYIGTWSYPSHEPDKYGADIAMDEAGTGTETATWTPNIPRTENYSVYAWWTAHSTRATDSPYTINYNGGSETIRINQEVNGGKWNYLGTWNFAAGTSGSVVMSDDANEYVIADAVAFVRGDNKPAVYAPNVIGDNSTYGFYATGHGRTQAVNCLTCHDATLNHIDHEHRTYEYDEGVGVVNPYCESYRLSEVNGLPALRFPNPGGQLDYWRHYALCFDCHDRYKVLNTNISNYNQPHTTNFWDASTTWGNAHDYHIGYVSYDSDWDLEGDTLTSCPTCHNVHGSPSNVMIRNGELISTPIENKIPALDFAYVLPSPDTPDTATYTPDFSEAGNYGVYAWWTDHYGRAPNAKYTIYYDGGSESIEINQKIYGGQWNLLGTYNFAAGTGGSVVLSNEGAFGAVIADAIGFDTTGDNNPDVIIDNDDPEAQFVGPWWTASHETQKYGADVRVSDMPEYPYDYNATLEESVGGVMRRGVQNIDVNKVCFTCHNSSQQTTYVRKPNVRPRVLIRQVAPSWVDNNGTDEVLLAAYVYSPKGNLTGVTIDLTSMDGSATQVMYDDGTHGDVTAGDNIYSYLTAVSPSASSGLKILRVTGTDGDGLTGSRNLTLMIANPGWIVVDNQDVAAANFVGTWGFSNESEAYYNLRCNYKDSGSGSAQASWTPTLTQAGNYNVYASWVEATNRATNAPYIINHSSGSDIVRVNQQESGREFVYLGTYYFDAQAGYTYVIIDNEDAEFVGTSWWAASHELLQYGANVRFHEAGTGANTATFRPDLPQAGDYDVYAWWTPHNSRATNAPYTINYSGGSATVLVNQEQSGGYWRYLGTYFFEAGTDGSVVLSDNANEYVLADAVKFQLSANKQNVVLRDDANNYVIADAILFEPVP